MILMIFTSVFFLISSYSSLLLPPNYDCSIEFQKCEATGDNLLNVVTDINTVAECRLLCSDENNCTDFTYFRSGNNLFQETCMMFNSCDSLKPCQDCVTEEADCFTTCSIPYYGSVNNDNLLRIIEDAKNETVCKKFCKEDEQCSIYSYFNGNDSTNPNLCILLNDHGLHHPVTQCDNCRTGPGKCDNVYRPCKVSVLIDQETGIETMLFETSRKAKLASGEKNCYSQFQGVAVGGGGNGGNHPYGGGGSGNITEHTLKINANSEIEITIEPAMSTTVKIEGLSVLYASSGGYGGGYGGGSGYSGGGATGGDGGSNGGDGRSHSDHSGNNVPGGSGSGFDVRSIQLNHFTLSPGHGGDGCYSNFCATGGGGGGVLVNGENSGLTSSGGGFGAGGNGDGYQGLSGCVILEIFP